MAVTVDDQSLSAQEAGLQTVGDLLQYVQRPDRLVVQVLIDGSEPTVAEMGKLRNVQLKGRTVYIETANPRNLAAQALEAVRDQLQSAEKLRLSAAASLEKNQLPAAMKELGECLRTWQTCQDAVCKTLEVLGLEPSQIRFASEGNPERGMDAMLAEFAAKLRAIKQALEQRDYVSLIDVLLYEMADANPQWCAAIDRLFQLIK